MARTDSSATPDTGLLKLAFRKADVSRLSVVGTDLVLVMKDGSQHVLQDMGLQAMTRPDLRVQFADGTADVSDLLAQAGPISLAKVVAEVAVSSGDGDPLQKTKAAAAEVSADALATSDATAASSIPLGRRRLVAVWVLWRHRLALKRWQSVWVWVCC